MDLFLLALRLLLAVTFAIAAIGKLADLAGARQSMLDFGVPAVLARPFAVLLPIAEMVCAVALIPVEGAWLGAAGVLAMLLLFMAGIGVSLAHGRRPDCHCFGQLHASPIGWKTLVRNGVLSGMAGLVVWQGPGNSGASVAGALRGLGGAHGVMAALAVVAVLQAWAIFELLQQNGRLLLRVEAIEGKLGIVPGAAAVSGLPAGSPAPDFSATRLEGGTVTLEELAAAGRPVLLLFTEPSCGACETLLPELSKWQEEHAGRLSLVVVSRGTPEANRAKAAEHKLRDVVLEKGREVTEAYRVAGTPSAVLVTEGKIASALAEGVAGIRALVTGALAPPKLKKGDPAPALLLPDLDGKTFDLSAARGRRTLLLFWSPSCGFCQQMLEDVKRWERRRPKDAPELLVISGGTSQENRAQGLLSPVLLDAHFAAGQVFGAEGTPAGVMLDEDGRVASEVQGGADAVMALAGAATVGSR